jgi:glycosyltransferase involved in cell wall biosynthesis
MDANPEQPNSNHKRVIAVLGMHRSGTSAIARSLQTLGVGLGDNLHPAGFDNPKGFWEDRDCIAINEELLEQFGSAYDHLNLAWNIDITNPAIASLYSKAVRLVSESVSKSGGIWGVKDPRMCRLLQFWKRVFDDCGCNVSYVITLRNPRSVAESLMSRNNIPYEKSYFLWLQHMVPIILDSRDETRVIVDYDLLMESPVEQITRIAQELDLPFDISNNNSLKDFLEGFLEKDLRHSSYTVSQLVQDDSLPADVFKAYKLLLRAAWDEISINAEEIQSTFEKLEDNLQAYAPAFTYANSLEAERTSLYHVIADQNAQIADQNAELLNNAEIINALTQQLSEMRASMAWNVAKRIQAFRLFVFPRGSSQEPILLFLIQALRVWRNEGIKALFQKIVSDTRQSLKVHFLSLTLNTSKSSLANLSGNSYVPIAQHDVDPTNILVKTIAFYLPQFHPIPENDAWWGKGFTEWTNVTKAQPNFAGHYQPHIPDELGYYDLRLPEIQKRQIELAKKYGIYGFCFYYYWFAGKRLLERPLDQYLANHDLDFPFCLCWANENWTRRWDGAEHEILMAQTYSEAEYLHFIQDISPNFSDSRYIRVDNKPMLLVYRINLLPDPQKAAEIWRAECKRLGIGEIYLVAVQSFGISDPRPYGFDAAVEFPPSHLGQTEIHRESIKITNRKFKGKIFDYNSAAQAMMERRAQGYPLFKTVMPAWDNTARRQNEGHIFVNATPLTYKNWLHQVITYTTRNLPESQRFVFVNAWNEWAEGTHLEPDRRYGYAYLKATAEAIQGFGNKKFYFPPGWKILFISHDAHKGGAQATLLNTLAWLQKHTSLSTKVLCLDGGVLLPRFQELADTILLSELQSCSTDQNISLLDSLLAFCGGKPDLIYGNTVVAGKAYTWLHQLNVPILTHVHELEQSINYYAANFIGDVFKYSDHYIACSHAVKDNLINKHNAEVSDVSVVYASIEEEPFGTHSARLNKKQKKKRFGLTTKKTVIMGCGIGMPFRKGADLFIKLGECLRQQGRSDFHLYWVGGFQENDRDPQYGSWEPYQKKLLDPDSSDFVTFLGFKENAKEYYKAADIFVLPSREDPFPLVALEAARAGLPIVCFADAGGAPDLVGEDAGFVVSFENVEAMAEKISLLIENSDLRATMGNCAREKFLAHFTVDRTTPDILATCRKVAGQRPAVSVIVPNYNHAKYLPARLESIFKQTFQDFEVILLDDASSDNSMDVFQQYAGYSFVHIHKNHQNSGSPFKQWLAGLEMATADILWIAESDDACKPEFIEKLIPTFQDPTVKLAYANSEVIDREGHVIGDYTSETVSYLTSLSPTKWKRDYTVSADQEINDALGIKNSILNVSAVLFRKFEPSLEAKKVLETMKIAGDWYFYVNAIKDGKVHYGATKWNSHRRHSASVIAQTVSRNKIREFFHEVALVHKYIFNTYQLDTSFQEKWEDYLLQQLRDFSPGSTFDDLKQVYPLDEIKTLISNAQGTFEG